MKKGNIVIKGLMLLALFCFCSGSWSAENKIPALKQQISVLEKEKAGLEAEKEKLIAEGDALSAKIETLKIQSRGGLGIIGRYRLSRNLRKAQALSEKTQNLEKGIYEVEAGLKDKRAELEREYEKEIGVLLGKMNGASKTEEKREILEKLKEYQTAKEQLEKLKKEELKNLDIADIEIKEYDGPQEIREKADLINDFANKLNDGIKALEARIERLQEEVKTRKRLGEFAEEISFFGERISKEEVASNTEESVDTKSLATETPTEPAETIAMPTEKTDATWQPTIPITEPSDITVTQLSDDTQPSTGKIIMERNGVSAAFMGVSLEQFEEEIRLLEKRKQELTSKLLELSKKADSFHKKADEIEKSEIKAGGKTR